MGLWPTKADGNPLADARGSAWDAHCKQSRDRKGADVFCLVGAMLLVCAAASAGGPEIIQKRCIQCHNAKTRVGGLSLETRADAEKVLGGRLLSRVESGQMPPGGGLADDERQAIATWLKEGAPWAARLTAASRPRAGNDWWSLQPIRVAGTGTIDGYILARLAEKGLRPSPPADRRTLIRRVTFDLTGLPPTPEEMETTESYEEMVDRLLASPAYGERWGRHWLDVIRFGESNGYEQNHIRPTAWPFRDYVVRAFNADKPFDRMILEQLAGDVVGKGDPEVEVATGFLVAGPHDTVGNQAEAAKRQQRADDYDDVVNATASAFLGMTVNCAKCHDHKFDPILQADYYRMSAVFAGVVHGEREIATAERKAAYLAAAAPIEKKIDEAKRAMDDLRKRADAGRKESEARVLARMRPAVSPFGTEEKFAAVRAKSVRLAAPQGAPGGLDEIEIWTANGRNVARDNAGATVAASSTRIADGNPDAYHARFLIDGAFDKRWFAGGGPGVTITIKLAREESVVRVNWSTDRQRGFQGKFEQQTLEKYALEVSLDGNRWTRIASNEGCLPAKKEELQRLFVLEALAEPDRVSFIAGEKRLAELEAQLRKIEKLPRVYAGTFRTPDPVFLLKGGNVMQRGDAMPAASLSALPGFTLPLDAPDAERRLELAKWIASDKNPLTPRVMANRIWQYHFGTGLVATPSDFGFNGERPSNPALLDYLANRLIENGWRLKPLHREIVLSAAYRQASAWNAAGAKADSDARLLWRFPPQRLEAEEIRDQMLAVAGVLDRNIGGPSFQLYKYTVDNVATYFPLDKFGPETYRRALYAQSARSIRTELLSVYDCPDSSLPEPRRVVTTTPLQALTLLNSNFTTSMAEAFAKRMIADNAGDPVGRGFALAFGRTPAPDEREAAARLVKQHGLAALARALFNANEFVYVH